MAPIGLKFNFHPHETVFPCDVRDMRSSEPKLYPPAIYVLGPYDVKKGAHVYDTYKYTIHYRENPGVKLANVGPQMGFHEGDTEFILSLHNKKTGTPEWVFYSAHSIQEGSWKSWDSANVENRDDKEWQMLNVYVALGSHANYPSPGIKYRVALLANDEASSSGLKWLVKASELVKATDELAAMSIGSNKMTKPIIPVDDTWSTTERITKPVTKAIKKKLSAVF